MDLSKTEKFIAGVAIVFGTYIVALLMLGATMVALTTYDRFKTEREAGQSCLVWDRRRP